MRHLFCTKLSLYVRTYVHTYVCMYRILYYKNSCMVMLNDVGATVSLNQRQYSVSESASSLRATITMSRRASRSVTVEVTVSDGSANGNVE